MLAKIQAGLWEPPAPQATALDDPTFHQFASSWLARRRPSYKQRTYEHYRYLLTHHLLPAFAAALLGATSVRPGRVNVWGTVIAVMLLAVAVAGLQQLGAKFYVEYLFNGGMVLIAVGAAGYVIRRRVATEGAKEPAEPSLHPFEQSSDSPDAGQSGSRAAMTESGQ